MDSDNQTTSQRWDCLHTKKSTNQCFKQYVLPLHLYPSHIPHQKSREQLYCFARPLLVFTLQASKRRLNMVSPLRKYQDPCIQEKQEPALVCSRSCGFGTEGLFEQRMWYHKQNKSDLSLQWPLKPLKIYISYIYFGAGVCVWWEWGGWGCKGGWRNPLVKLLQRWEWREPIIAL